MLYSKAVSHNKIEYMILPVSFFVFESCGSVLPASDITCLHVELQGGPSTEPYCQR